MDEEQYSSLLAYIKTGQYPADYCKSKKFVLRRCSKNYKVLGDLLYYVDRNKDGSTADRLVIRGIEEAERIFKECHLTTGGHRGRDSTINKVKARYYWPNYYKEIENKVRDSSLL